MGGPLPSIVQYICLISVHIITPPKHIPTTHRIQNDFINNIAFNVFVGETVEDTGITEEEEEEGEEEEEEVEEKVVDPKTGKVTTKKKRKTRGKRRRHRTKLSDKPQDFQVLMQSKTMHFDESLFCIAQDKIRV